MSDSSHDIRAHIAKMKSYCVIKSYADLRREPNPHLTHYEKDSLQETQLLYGEHLVAHKEIDGWVFIEAIEQLAYKNRKWQGYPGWVERESLVEVKKFPRENIVVTKKCLTIDSMTLFFGTKLQAVGKTMNYWKVKLPNNKIILIDKSCASPLQFSREMLLSFGIIFLDDPYLWGGRTPYTPNLTVVPTSVDCSGLVNLIYRACGVTVPRDAHDQFLRCNKVLFSSLKLGDPIFMSPVKSPDRIDHVAIYAGGDSIIEATINPGKVRRISAQQRFGVRLSEISQKTSYQDYFIHFGSFF